MIRPSSVVVMGPCVSFTRLWRSDGRRGRYLISCHLLPHIWWAITTPLPSILRCTYMVICLCTGPWSCVLNRHDACQLTATKNMPQLSKRRSDMYCWKSET